MEPDQTPTDEDVTPSKVSEAISKIKKNRRLVPQTLDMLAKNPEMQRNAINLVESMNMTTTLGPNVSKKERKKALARNDLVMSHKRSRLKDGEIKCVHMLVKGKVVPYAIDLDQVEKEDRWSVGSVVIEGQDFIYVCDSTLCICPSNKMLNKRASSILGQKVYGIVAFILLDEELDPVDISPKEFPSTS